MMSRILLAIVVVSLGLSLSACKENDHVIIKVGKKNITETILKEKLAMIAPEYQKYINTSFGKKQFINAVLKETIIMESAKKAGIEKKPEYENAVNDFKTEQQKQLNAYKDIMLIETYMKEIYKKIMSTSTDIEAYYNENRSLFENPRAHVVRHILVFNLQTAQDTYKRLKNGESFSKVAKEVSRDTESAVNGGLAGPFKTGDIFVIPEFEQIISNLKNNEMSKIIKTPYGYHIILKISEYKLPKISFDKAKENIKKIIEKEKFNVWLTNEQQKLKVKISSKLWSF